MDYKNELLQQISNNPKCLDVILDFIVDTFLIVDQQGNILRVNQNAFEILKFPEEELLDMKLEELEIGSEKLTVANFADF